MTKRFLSMLLLAAILLSAPTALAAKKKKKVEPEPEPPKIVAAYEMVTGTIKAVNSGAKTIEIDRGGELGSILLQMGKEPAIVDNTKRSALAFNKVKTGMAVRAWHSNTVTASLPPQSSCYAMVVNIEDAAAAPNFMEVEQVFRSGGTYTLLNQPQDMRLSVSASTKITAFKRGDSNKITALKPGTRLLYWADSVMESYPAQASAKSVLLFPYAYEGYILMDQGYLNVNGHMLEGKAITEEDGTLLVPGLEACNRLGLSPYYVKSTQTLRLKISTRVSAELVAGQAAFKLGKETIAIPAPKVVDYVLYIPLEAVLQFKSYKYVANS